MHRQYDVAVIGAGIVGLAHAWAARRRGQNVVLLERSPVARGASVRNFGMIWPIGQPAGQLYHLALQSREFWIELGSLGVVDVEQCGSIHLAHREDELAVLEEFCDLGSHQVSMLNSAAVLEATSLANPNGLLAGMYSPVELRVDPRTASARIAIWLESQQEVHCHFTTPVVGIEDNHIRSADGRTWTAQRIIICSGSDLHTLYPNVLLNAGLQLCKLQMLKAIAQPSNTEPTPHIASGLTLRHYSAFEGCRSHSALRRRIASETPELDRFGIHVMASQFPGGEVILGDSHEYDDCITPFDSSEIDNLILRELRKILTLTDWGIVQRWHGIYAKHSELPVFETEIDQGVHAFVGTGGAGMTMSFGLAEQAWKRWLGEDN